MNVIVPGKFAQDTTEYPGLWRWPPCKL